MTKGKRKPTRVRKTAQGRSQNALKAAGAPSLSRDEQAEATKRMADVFKAISQAPEGFIPWLDRLHVKYQLLPGKVFGEQEFSEMWDDNTQYLLIKMTDLIAGEELNQEQGSILSRLSRKRIDDKVSKFIAEYDEPQKVSPEAVWNRMAGLREDEGE